MIDEHTVATLFYNPETNRFIDEFGIRVDEIFRYITPGQLLVFKKNKDAIIQNGGSYVVPNVKGTYLIELIYPDEKGVLE